MGRVAFDASRHDDAAKELLGGEIPRGLGESEVDHVVDRVCAHPSTARFVARKLCVRYLDDEPSGTALDAVADAFTRSGARIDAALRCMFLHDEFRKARGTKLKRPFALVASALRACEADVEETTALLAHLERMGHATYQWPTPDGYPAASLHWRAGLLGRWRFAHELASDAIDGVRIDATELWRRAGGRAPFAAHALARAATAEELATLDEVDDDEALALLLASPGFQRC